MLLKVGDLFNDFLSLIYPNFCEACHKPLVKGEDIICTYCISDLPRTSDHFYPENPLFIKFRGRVPIVWASAFLKFQKKGKVQRLLHAFKYRDRPDIGVKLGKVYAHELLRSNAIGELDLIVPVPLHPARQRQRGYNQSERWATGLGEILSVPVGNDVLHRAHKTETQTKRTKLRRWENVVEAFEATAQGQIADKNILLVDDVVTTGSTLEACAHTLIQSGCKSVSIVCLAAAK